MREGGRVREGGREGEREGPWYITDQVPSTSVRHTASPAT